MSISYHDKLRTLLQLCICLQHTQQILAGIDAAYCQDKVVIYIFLHDIRSLLLFHRGIEELLHRLIDDADALLRNPIELHHILLRRFADAYYVGSILCRPAIFLFIQKDVYRLVHPWKRPPCHIVHSDNTLDAHLVDVSRQFVRQSVEQDTSIFLRLMAQPESAHQSLLVIKLRINLRIMGMDSINKSPAIVAQPCIIVIISFSVVTYFHNS